MRSLLLASLLALGLAQGTSARLITFFPTELNFGSVDVGDTAWEEVRFRYSGADGGRMKVGIRDYLNDLPVRMMMPEAEAYYPYLDSIEQAAIHWREDFGGDPWSIDPLLEHDYLYLPDTLLQQWDFSFIHQDPITHVEGVSTDRFRFGQDLVILLALSPRVKSGWGITYGNWNMTHNSVYTLPVCFVPTQDCSYSDTIKLDVMRDTTLIEPITIRIRGNGVLEIEEHGHQLQPTTIDLTVFPNPFNSLITLDFTLRAPAEVRLSVIAPDGRELAVLRKGYYAAGFQSAAWNAGDAPAGIYFARLQSDDRIAVRRLILVK